MTQDIGDKLDTKNLYDTPIYKTRQRGAFKKGNIKYKNLKQRFRKFLRNADLQDEAERYLQLSPEILGNNRTRVVKTMFFKHLY